MRLTFHIRKVQSIRQRVLNQGPLSRKPRALSFVYRLNSLRYYGQFIDSLEVYLDTY